MNKELKEWYSGLEWKDKGAAIKRLSKATGKSITTVRCWLKNDKDGMRICRNINPLDLKAVSRITRISISKLINSRRDYGQV